MPIPRGAHYVSGNNNRVQLESGDIVTRATARTMGARDMGYHNEHAYRGHAAGDTKQFNSWLNTEQGQHALETAKANGLSKTELKSQFVGARNGRPHPGSGKTGNDAYHEFMEEYDLEDYGDDWADY
jgi:hypothetical protein